MWFSVIARIYHWVASFRAASLAQKVHISLIIFM